MPSSWVLRVSAAVFVLVAEALIALSDRGAIVSILLADIPLVIGVFLLPFAIRSTPTHHHAGPAIRSTMSKPC